MDKIVTKQQNDLNFGRRKTAEISNNFYLSNRWRTHWISVLYFIIWQI